MAIAPGVGRGLNEMVKDLFEAGTKIQRASNKMKQNNYEHFIDTNFTEVSTALLAS